MWVVIVAERVRESWDCQPPTHIFRGINTLRHFFDFRLIGFIPSYFTVNGDVGRCSQVLVCSPLVASGSACGGYGSGAVAVLPIKKG